MGKIYFLLEIVGKHYRYLPKRHDGGEEGDDFEGVKVGTLRKTTGSLRRRGCNRFVECSEIVGRITRHISLKIFLR